MEKRFTAEDAKANMASYEKDATTSPQYKSIIIQVKRESSAGKNSMFYYETIEPNVKRLLEQDGFVIKNMPHRNDTLIQINW